MFLLSRQGTVFLASSLPVFLDHLTLALHLGLLSHFHPYAFPSTLPVPSGTPCFLYSSNLCQCLSPPPVQPFPADGIPLCLAPRAALTPQRQDPSSGTILPLSTSSCSKTLEFHRSQLLQFLGVGWKLPAHSLFLFSFNFWHFFCKEVQSRKTPTWKISVQAISSPVPELEHNGR